MPSAAHKPAQPDGPPEPVKSREAGKAMRPANGTGQRCAPAGLRRAGKRGEGEDSGPAPSARYRGDQPGGLGNRLTGEPAPASARSPADQRAGPSATAPTAGRPRRPAGRPGLGAQPSAAGRRRARDPARGVRRTSLA
jgi:hypothetical protein